MSVRAVAEDNSWREIFPPMIYHFKDDESVYVEPLEAGGGDRNWIQADELGFIVKPGSGVIWMGERFVLEREGLHCLMRGIERELNVIVYERDEFALFRAMTHLQAHGPRHNDRSHEERLAILKTGAISLTCGPVSAFCARLFEGLGIRCRRVGMLTLDDWNGYNNGHDLIEYFHEASGEWRLVDIDAHLLFRGNDEYLNLDQFNQAILNGDDYQLESLGSVGRFDPFAKMAPFCYRHLVPGKTREWFRRVGQSVRIFDERRGEHVFGEDDPEKTRRIMSYSANYVCVSRKEWLERYYG